LGVTIFHFCWACAFRGYFYYGEKEM